MKQRIIIVQCRKFRNSKRCLIKFILVVIGLSAPGLASAGPAAAMLLAGTLPVAGILVIFAIFGTTAVFDFLLGIIFGDLDRKHRTTLRYKRKLDKADLKKVLDLFKIMLSNEEKEFINILGEERVDELIRTVSRFYQALYVKKTDIGGERYVSIGDIYLFKYCRYYYLYLVNHTIGDLEEKLRSDGEIFKRTGRIAKDGEFYIDSHKFYVEHLYKQKTGSKSTDKTWEDVRYGDQHVRILPYKPHKLHYDKQAQEFYGGPFLD